MNISGLVKFIKERHAIYTRRNLGAPKPWTKDSILQNYKFCNVYRELDKVTVWITDNWRTPHAADPDLWFAMVVARLLNRPSTLGALGYPVPWNRDKFVKLVHKLKAAKEPAFSGAYMISTHGHKADKAEFLADRVLTPLWKARKFIRPRDGDTLAEFHARLTKHFGMGSFLGAQVVADIKYVAPLKAAEDWWTWAASGPGSRRGLNRVAGFATGKHWSEESWRDMLIALHAKINISALPALHAQDLQNCLCEFDKYERVRLGEGRMKCKYNGRK